MPPRVTIRGVFLRDDCLGFVKQDVDGRGLNARFSVSVNGETWESQYGPMRKKIKTIQDAKAALLFLRFSDFLREEEVY